MSAEDREITKAVADRIERNRQKALTIKQGKLMVHPYSTKSNTAVSIDKSTIQIGHTKYKDTGGGFLLEETSQSKAQELKAQPLAPSLKPFRPTCVKCAKMFAVSWLFDTFEYKCCDECKDPTEHKLITKTEALNTYLLKDVDLDKRDFPLKFITKKNPHHASWGEMKLFLKTQVEERALEVWGSEEKMEEEREKREEKKVATKSKKYQKQLKELRMSMRSSLYDRTTTVHVHEFGTETYNEAEDTYTRGCQTCSYKETFEKM